MATNREGILDLSGEFKKNQPEQGQEIGNQINFAEVAKALDQFLTQNPDTKYLVLGENHNDQELHAKMLSHPNIISTLHKYDLTTTAIELPAVIQPFFETAQNEGQTLDEFASAFQKECENQGVSFTTIEGLKKALSQDMLLMNAGNNVVYYDNPDYSISMLTKRHEDGVDADFYERTANSDAKRSYLRGLAKNRDELTTKNVLSNPEDFDRLKAMGKGKALGEEGSNAYKRYEKFKAIRVNEKDETLRAEHVKENSVEGAVVLAGHAHGFGFRDLDEKLGPNTVRLSVVPDMETYIKRSQVDYSSGNEAPEGYLILEEAKIISGTDAYAAAQKFETDVENALNGEKAPTIEKTTEVAPHIAEPC